MQSAILRASLLFRWSRVYSNARFSTIIKQQLTTHGRERLHILSEKAFRIQPNVWNYRKLSSQIMGSEPSTINLKALGENFVKKVPTMEQVKLESLWKDSTTVVIFLRRFGCIFCRQSAMEISKLRPILQKNNVRLFAVGLEEFGYEEFVEGKYFNGDLYIDIDEASYKEIGYKKYSTISVLMSLLHKTARDAISKVSRADGLSGNLKGNGLQTGGTLIVSDGGTKILMDYRQTNPADHVANSEILKALGIAEDKEDGSASNTDPKQ
ncbi:Prostamide/prostaglandin F synthase [Pseudolycoriella hygida]|uniref:Prostamide/prostaglandin F synthase n=1 Tax=Pseudolycoriella hygida TaxID=35572 RepID=A0A9Q0RZ88_9DIPT|nr:Prostamide/prostaglandin F synthase [Pseudolycoriella hygida]